MIKFKDLPVEIQHLMLDEQERQGFQRDETIFITNDENKFCFGFFTEESLDGDDFWSSIVLGNYQPFYDKYGKIQEQAQRFNHGKLQWNLVSFEALKPLVEVLMFGAKKYAPHN